MGMYKFKLPDVGEGMAEGTIGKWHVKIGDTIKKDADLVQIENDKSVEEIPSPVSGVVKKIVVPEGQTADVGDTLVEIQTDDDENQVEEEQNKDQSPKHETAPKHETPQVKEQSDNKEQSSKNVQFKQQDHSLPVLAMPSVRAYAREKHVDLSKIKGTGNHNQVTKADIDHFLQNDEPNKIIPKVDLREKSNAEVPQNSGQKTQTREHHEKMDSVRLATAKSVAHSASEIPHVTLFDEVVVDQLWNHRNLYKEKAAKKGIHLTFMPYIVKALAIVAKEFPILNATVDMDKREIIYKDNINIGIATETDRGLFMPNIKEADKLSMFEIARQIEDNTKAIGDGTLANDKMQNGSISITNIGSIGGGYFTPIIDYPEVAILGIGKIENQPIVDPEDDDNVIVGKVMKLSLSIDHRAIDGATAQKVLNRLKELLSDPGMLLMEG